MMNMSALERYALQKGKVSETDNLTVFEILDKIAQIVMVRHSFNLFNEDREDVMADMRLYALEGLLKPYINFDEYDSFNLVYSRMRNYLSVLRRRANRYVFMDSVEAITPAYSLSPSPTLHTRIEEELALMIERAPRIRLDVEENFTTLLTAAVFRAAKQPDASLRRLL